MRFRPNTECPICSCIYKEDDFETCPGEGCPGETDRENKE
jgi:hypothetical protein